MTREEAITRIKDHIEIHRYHERNAVKIFEALDMAIKALEQEPCEDAVSREAAIDAALSAFSRGLLASPDIRKLPSVQPEPQWIPVKERLPKQDEMVLITIIRKDERYNKIPFISIGYISWNNTVWWCAHDGDCKSANVEVLAWMPLPEPYRAERRTDE